jgi:peptidyl-prolyl cis-trans isomerase SurA
MLPEAAALRAQKPEQDPNPLNGVGQARGARIVAVVNGSAILDEEVHSAAYAQLAGVRTEAEKAQILKEKLDEIIDRELVIQDAEMRLGTGAKAKFLDELRKVASQEFEKQWLHKLMRANNHTDVAAFTAFLRSNGLSVPQVRRQWERNFICMEYARGRLEGSISRISQQEVAAYYNKHAEEFKVEESVEWQDLFIQASKHPTREAAREMAASLAARARRGEDFVKLAKQFDDGDSSLRPNADGIGNRRGDIRPPEVEPALFALKEGEVSDPVAIETGFHVVRVVKKTEAGKMPLDAKLQRSIREKLRADAFMREMKRFVSDLRRSAVIQKADF